jgi:hypothetical protein
MFHRRGVSVGSVYRTVRDVKIWIEVAPLSGGVYSPLVKRRVARCVGVDSPLVLVPAQRRVRGDCVLREFISPDHGRCWVPWDAVEMAR